MPAKVFFCYAHEDEELLNKLKTHLMPLQRQGLIDVWYDRDISAGTVWEQEIEEHLNTAQIVLLLVSPDFMNSDYCYSIELKRSIERHDRKEARVIPIILRHVYWQGVLGKLQALPTDAIPVMSSSWHYQDEAFYNVAEGIRKVVEQLIPKSSLSSPTSLPVQPSILEPKIPPTPPMQSLPVRKPTQPLGTTLHTYYGHGGVHSVAWSPNGNRIASGEYGAVRVWDAVDGRKVVTYKGHNGFVQSVTWSPDGSRIASAGDGKAVQVWDAVDGRKVMTYKGHNGSVYSVAWSPDGSYIASGSDDKTVKVWQAV